MIRRSLLILLLAAAATCLALPAGAEVQIITNDGRVFRVPVTRREIKEIRFLGGPGHGQVRRTQVYQLFGNVPQASTDTFRGSPSRFTRVDTATNRWNRVPFHMAKPFLGTIRRHPNQRVFLAGNRAGNAGWRVDNFLLITITSSRGTVRRAVGDCEPVRFRGRPVPFHGPKSFNFRAGQIDLTRFVPAGENVSISVAAYDNGGVGYVSPVFLIVR